MSRSGYTEDGYCSSREELWAQICWRGAVTSAMRGKKGQAFFKELLAALDAMPDKRLIKDDLVTREFVAGDGIVVKPQMCAIGALCVAKGLDMSNVDVGKYEYIAQKLGINAKLVQEVEWENDECYTGSINDEIKGDAQEKRWHKMRAWVLSNIKPENRDPEAVQQ